jgi:hypothetical protein
MLDTVLISAANLDAEAQKQLFLTIVGHTNVFSYILGERRELLNTVLDALSVECDHYRRVKNYFAETNFVNHLSLIKAKSDALSDKAAVNQAYRVAASTAQTLYNDLLAAATQFCQPELDQALSAQKQQVFKQSCLANIYTAMPVLENHRGWKEVITIILLALTFPISLPIYGIGRALGFFPTLLQTDSATKLHQMEDDMNHAIMA